MAEEPEEGFVIRDRRRFTSDGSNAAPVAPAQEIPVQVAAVEAIMPPSLPESAGEFLAEGMEEGDDVQGTAEYAEGDENTIPDIYSVLIMFLGEMRNHSLLRLGLVPNPMNGQMERDLEQARVAINTAGFLAKQLEPVLPPEERLPLQAMLSDLQTHFVEQARREN